MSALDIRLIDIIDALASSAPDEISEYDMWCGWVAAAEHICQKVKDRNPHLDENQFLKMCGVPV